VIVSHDTAVFWGGKIVAEVAQTVGPAHKLDAYLQWLSGLPNRQTLPLADQSMKNCAIYELRHNPPLNAKLLKIGQIEAILMRKPPAVR